MDDFLAAVIRNSLSLSHVYRSARHSHEQAVEDIKQCIGKGEEEEALLTTRCVCVCVCDPVECK